MKSKSFSPELMAPAGNLIHLQTAIHAGADAIYFGSSQFNMRARARNFSPDDLVPMVNRCHEAGVKAYLTVNTIVYENELDDLRQLLIQAGEAKTDMVIAWDWGVIDLCQELGVPFAISTQGSVSNSAGIRLAEKLGAKRVVLARECSLEDLRLIREKSSLEIEVFVHGAMCVAVSGRCFMSHELFNHSANRGDCIQPCRRTYEVTATDTETGDQLIIGEDSIMSPSDLCALPFLDQLIASGVHSLKIEGRKRSPEYVQVVTGVYRQAIDAVMEDRFTPDRIQNWMEQLGTVFNRGFSSGFYLDIPGESAWSAGPSNQSAWHKEYIGKMVTTPGVPGSVSLKIEARNALRHEKVVLNSVHTGVAFFDLNWKEDQQEAIQGTLVTPDAGLNFHPGDQIYAWIMDSKGDKSE